MKSAPRWFQYTYESVPMLLQLKRDLQPLQAVSVICKQTGKRRGSVKG
jgi:hypothetical protein